jgi:23S rRNA pseudouridine1911/1915/1917 synthase
VAQTEWRVLQRLEGQKTTPGARAPHFALLECRLLTGRTHQIRVHLAHLGHPLLGDALYASSPAARAAAPRQMLHAWRLGFRHPRSGETLEFRAPVPVDFLAFGLDSRELER